MSPKNLAIFIGAFLKNGIGYQIKIPLFNFKYNFLKYCLRFSFIKIYNIPDILNKVWHKAICSEFFKVFGLELKLARIPVIVVPTFEPKVKGNNLSTETIPIPTKGTKVEVNTELL